MGDRVRPLGERDGRRAADESPVEGVPPWLFGPLWGWICDRFPVRGSVGPRMSAIGEFRAIAVMLRTSLDDPAEPNPRSADGLRNALYARAQATPEILLDVADYWLRTTEWEDADRGDTRAAEDLARLLSEGGSAYRIDVAGTPILARRGAPEAEAALEGLRAAGRPGAHLSKAWRAAFGRYPDAATAYREALRAVELAAVPVVCPGPGHATLSTALAELQDSPDRFRVDLPGPDPLAQVEGLLGMLDLLWQGRLDARDPREITGAQAQAAVHLAMTLVNFFTTGVVSLR